MKNLLISIFIFSMGTTVFAASAIDNPNCVAAAKKAVESKQPSADISEPEAGGISAQDEKRSDLLTVAANVQGDYYYVYVVTLKNIDKKTCSVSDLKIVDSGY